ncbi:hypothetical protein [Pseudaminobacter soli (ex Li et al. 2025)]|uniref:Calcineurin-like phosphoesterase domain-containing protein n=1 Tax=Pseudaminobacter soli (ex Li et al. 2025) TaxID=1295366 RepID=A0A2P7RZT4_9HYPH|nr:hypothetical protein [Mesorhizobium soli]PSJ55747.1 hypothetical protein C7I85_26005 [Mesorhizobium soli]
MANPDGVTKTDPDDLLRIRQLLPEFTRLDQSVNYNGLAKAAGMNRMTARRRIQMIVEADRKTNQEAYTPDVEPDTFKARARVRAFNPNVVKDIPARKVIAIGDLHIKPGMDFEHMRWIGRHVAAKRPDNVVQIGDCFDIGSCEFHSAPGSAGQLERPSFQDDIGAGEEAFDIYHSEVAAGEIPHDEILGNHEFRVWRLEELAPNLAGTLTLQLEQFFARYRWRTTPYRHWLFLEGVGFTHVPHSIMGKPIGGRYPENTIGNQATHSIVFGHTHRNNHVTVPKIGINNSITITNLGSAMPYGYTPKYTDGATTGYTYGIHELRLRGGRVESDKFISMLELEELYA